jgi:hypothetical protein
MGVIVVEEIEDDFVVGSTTNSATVTEVIGTNDSVVDITKSVEVVEVVRPGGTVTNVLWGYGFPNNPTEGMIWIDVS